MDDQTKGKAGKTGLAQSTGRAARWFLIGSWSIFKPKKLLNLEEDDSIVPRGSILKTGLDALKVPSPDEVRKESFAQAMERLNLTEAQVEERRQQLLIESRIYYACMSFLLAIGLYYASVGVRSVAVGVIFVASACATLGWLRTFRVWQIEIRRLAPLKEFLGHPEKWII